MKKVLTIAGSDSSGGAGIQADIKTMTNHNVYAMSVITAITAQNTLGVQKVFNLGKEIISAQLDSIFLDIFPDATKIGMVSNIEIIKVISEKLTFYNAKNIVLDPVMIATSNGKLIDNEAISTLCEKLFPLATLITPNLFEAQTLSNLKITNKNGMKKAAEFLFDKYKVPFLIKGGHLNSSASDLLITKNGYSWYEAPLIDNMNTHGTGCTLSSSIASNLAKGDTLEKAIENSKKYLSRAINYKLNIGKGRGPLYHNVKS